VTAKFDFCEACFFDILEVFIRFSPFQKTMEANPELARNVEGVVDSLDDVGAKSGTKDALAMFVLSCLTAPCQALRGPDLTDIHQLISEMFD